MNVKPSQQQIDEVISKCRDMQDEGENPFFGLNYLDGVVAALEWVLFGDENPIDD